MITPGEITKKAINLYPKFLKNWVRGEAKDFFPRTLPANLKLHPNDVPDNIRAVGLLREKSKAERGWGYTVHWRQVKSSSQGLNRCPRQIEIDSLDDLLQLAQKKKNFEDTRETVRRIREELPALAKWMESNVRTLAKHAEDIEDLIAVTKFFQANPIPDCYARQIPVEVHTKFIEDHEAVLRQWFDILLPGSAVDVNETTFAGRFGLRDKQRHHALRLLDAELLGELQLPFQELSLPARSLKTLSVCNTTVIVVENQIPLLTLPTFPRTLGICGEGKAVVTLHRLPWLKEIPILYWGDLDVPGFQILSSLRNIFPQVESILMDLETLETHHQRTSKGKGLTAKAPSNLTDQEKAAFLECRESDLLLEQERIPQSDIDKAFRERLAPNFEPLSPKRRN